MKAAYVQRGPLPKQVLDGMLAALEVEVDGDAATAGPKRRPLHLRKTPSGWKVISLP